VKKTTEYIPKWSDLLGALIEYETTLFYFKKSPDFLEQLLTALSGDLQEHCFALDVIGNIYWSQEQLEIIIPKLINIAVDGHVSALVRARKILVELQNKHDTGLNDAGSMLVKLNHKDTIVKDKLASMIESYLDSEDYYVYIRLAELLCDLHFYDLQKKLVIHCKTNKNRSESLGEVYEDIIEIFGSNFGWGLADWKGQ
jgi:hypothetical protein